MSCSEYHKYNERYERQPKSFNPHYLFYTFCHRRVEIYHELEIKYHIAPLPKCYLRDAKHDKYYKHYRCY